MLSNGYFLAKFRFDTAENEPAKNLQNFAKFCQFGRAAGWWQAGDRGRPGRCAPPAQRGTPPVELPEDALAALLGRTELSNNRALKGSFSAVSKPKFASKYALERSLRDLHNALLCTALHSQCFGKMFQFFLLLPNFY